MGKALSTTAAHPQSKPRVKDNIRYVEPVNQSTPTNQIDPDTIQLDPVTARQPREGRQQAGARNVHPVTARQPEEVGKVYPVTAREPEEVGKVYPVTAREPEIAKKKPPPESLYPYHADATYRKRDDARQKPIPYYDDSDDESPRQLYPHNCKWLQYDIAREPVIGGLGQGYRVLRRDWNKGAYKFVSVDCLRDPTVRWELDRSICARLREDKYLPYLTDITVAETVWGSAIVVGDHMNKSVKCFFYKTDHYRHSCFHLNDFPKGITRSTLSGVAVAIPDAKKILFLSVTPELKYNYHVITQKKYHYLASITETKLAASAPWEHVPTVDVVDSSGHVISSVCAHGPILTRPTYLTVTPNKELIIVDKAFRYARWRNDVMHETDLRQSVGQGEMDVPIRRHGVCGSGSRAQTSDWREL
ncbi:uncharacterized protein LOC121387738 [Gigantopelta aegis]|uniref:uncharacterized protein LOC121387738 n=1 Tax=Gigantopelta aegis TaxID=1735272 RepID=UPI001B88A2D9|nr:uncharacterized protein LOC121387738 [Gigantopelta aegis]